MEKKETCEYCYWWDFGVCDLSGRVKEEEDTCRKWKDNGEDDDGR